MEMTALRTTETYQTMARIAQRSGLQFALERARSAYCGAILGREFGETVEQYRARCPRAAALWLFIHGD